MNLPTTAGDIRDRMIAVIRGLVPSLHAGDRFEHLEDDGDAELPAWAEAFPQSAFRLFQVRDDGNDRPTEAATNLDLEERFVTFIVRIAYSHEARTADGAALDRDALIESDELLIDDAIGATGRENFSPPYPDACWQLEGSSPPARTPGRGCDFLVFRVRMSFVQSF